MESNLTLSPRYQSYVLRLRWVGQKGEGVCQAMLQSVATQERKYFHDLESLLAFLKSQRDDLSVAAIADD